LNGLWRLKTTSISFKRVPNSRLKNGGLALNFEGTELKTANFKQRTGASNRYQPLQSSWLDNNTDELYHPWATS
jgi:hypothetical protein